MTSENGDTGHEDALQKPPLDFVSGLEHDLRGALAALEGWWSLLNDPDATEYHDEARREIGTRIEALIELVNLIRQYKDRHRNPS